MDYKVYDKQLNASVFLSFVNQIWLGNYDAERTQNALSKTLNITAYDGAAGVSDTLVNFPLFLFEIFGICGDNK